MSFLNEIFLSFFLSAMYSLRYVASCRVALCCRTNSSFSSLIIESSSGSSGVNLELEPDAGGGKGWPTNASVVLYHREHAIIVAGSDSGAVYAYGDGFQYMKAPEDLQDPKAVIFLLSMSEDQVLAVYEDNSMTMLNLPDLTSTGAAQAHALGVALRARYHSSLLSAAVSSPEGLEARSTNVSRCVDTWHPSKNHVQTNRKSNSLCRRVHPGAARSPA